LSARAGTINTMPTGNPLTTEQLDHLRTELAGGGRPMVWFTSAAVGVAAGRSAKVLAMVDPPEGDFIQVRPTGSKDELSFSPNELTMDKPPRKRKDPEPERPLALPPVPPAEPDELLVVREKPGRRRAPTKPPEPATREPLAKPEPAKPRRQSGRSKPLAPITVSLTSTQDGDWTVEVHSGSRRTVRAQPVSPSAVALAARALGGDIETAIEGAINAAREQQRARVEQLEADLAAARQALDELSG
jgi:hypothetical protein